MLIRRTTASHLCTAVGCQQFCKELRKLQTRIISEHYYSFFQYCRLSCRYVINCNCNYIFFTKLPWPGDSEGTFRSSSQAATCPPVYHTRRKLHTVPLIAEREAGKLWIPIFIVFGLTRPGIEPESTASVADALSNRLLIGSQCDVSRTYFE